MDYDLLEQEDERAQMLRRARRIEEMRRNKRKQQQMRRILGIVLPAGAVFLVAVIVFNLVRGMTAGALGDDTALSGRQKQEALASEASGRDALTKAAEAPEGGKEAQKDAALTAPIGPEAEKEAETAPVQEEASLDGKSAKAYFAKTNEDTRWISDIVSSQAILIDLETDTILAQKDYKTIINPASMTKILTVLVAAEQIKKEELDDTFTMTIDITDYSYVNDCSNVGFEVGETMTVRDLFYGTVLPSGADAALGLAVYVSGSQEEFVKLMNEKLKELGLSDTAHFTNCVGLYDENHYCTVYDMAMILRAALDNELCREVLSAHTYTTSKTNEHPEGITISNWFLRRIEDKDTGGEVVCGKTGYVAQSGSCAASYAEDGNGKGYICVTANANSSWRCIYDQVDIYSAFMGEASL